MALTKVTSGVIAANAVVDSFGTQSITGDKIGLTAVNANNIVTGAVTGDKLGATSINANNIVDSSITGDKIGVGQITANLFASGAVSTTSISNGNSNVSIVSANSNVSIFTAGTERISVITNGDVGIGTSSPECKLQVGGLIRATGLTNPSTGSGVEIGYDGTQGVIQAFSNRATATLAPVSIVGDLKFNSGYGSLAVAYGCRAWVNFNGTGTVAIRASGNVSSITDVGAGIYTVNFTTAMPDANYAVTVNVRNTNNGDFGNVSFDTDITTSAAKVNSFNSLGASIDVSSCYVTIFR